MTKVSLFKKFGSLNSGPVFDAFEISLKNQGFTVVYDDMDADIAVIWSMLWYGRMQGNRDVWNSFKSLNKPVIILEIGSINRGTTWRIGLDGLSRKHLIYNFDDVLRVDKLGMKNNPWRTSGEYILICGQHDKSNAWINMPRMSTWVSNTIETIRQYTDMQIIFRPHPRCLLPDIETTFKKVRRQTPTHLSNTYDNYDLSFKNAHAVVNWSSSPGPLAIQAGIPAFVGPDSMAYSVGNADLSTIENPLMPNRDQWLHDYAASEFTLKEIQDGVPLNILTNMLYLL